GNSRRVTQCRVYRNLGSDAAAYDIQYSDDGSTWTTVAWNFQLTVPGWNPISWADAGAHRYWRLLLTNTPGVAPWKTELELYEAGGPTGITTTNAYNNRLQPSVISATSALQTVLSFSYSFDQDPSPSVVKNNGNVVQIVNNRDTNRSQSFTYDQLNRVVTAQSQATSGANCWGNSFAYDIWANLLSKTVTKCTSETLSVAVNTNNRITNPGFTYDSAGNLTNSGSGVITYDAENRIATVAGVTYTYDGDGERVKKSNGKLYWTGNDPLAESDLSGNLTAEYIFFGGRRIARLDLPTAAVHYYHADHLGSSNVVSNSTGTVIEDESDFYPFGGERVITNSDPNQYKFTGKERDPESGLDYFIARHYSSNLGRFLQPDEFSGGPVDAFSSSDPLPPGPLPYADITNPQSLNKYSYTYNNPLRYTDPNGHDAWDFLLGAANAFGSNFLAGAGRLEGGNSDFQSGQALGDAASIAGGAVEFALGAGLEIGGLALDATGVGAVVGVPANAVGAVAIAQGATAMASGSYQLSKSVSNPYGSKGKPDHQRAVERVVNKAKAEAKPGEQVLRERKVQGHDLNRKPDAQIVGTDKKTRKVFEAERRPNSQYHQKREADYKNCGIKCDTQQVLSAVPRR
ncbi:MAG: hypothetical protein L0212_06570, partial [Acidobacteria bacterium]|nr:hypothetical protein [Acidobacteriota bacterium]